MSDTRFRKNLIILCFYFKDGSPGDWEEKDCYKIRGKTLSEVVHMRTNLDNKRYVIPSSLEKVFDLVCSLPVHWIRPDWSKRYPSWNLSSSYVSVPHQPPVPVPSPSPSLVQEWFEKNGTLNDTEDEEFKGLEGTKADRVGTRRSEDP